jgi:cyclopropane-fatty-acyl-phospholipid synthase
MNIRQQTPRGSERQSSVSIATDRPAKNQARKPIQATPRSSERKFNSMDFGVAWKLLDVLGRPAIRLSFWDGTTIPDDGEEPVATLHFRDRAALYQTLWYPELHWGDLYAEGRVDVEGDLSMLLHVVYQGLRKNGSPSWLTRLNRLVGDRKIFNTRSRAADNIHHHYDIGNDFYRLWLDRVAMQYTCAYYPDPDLPLEDAQIAKMRHVCRKLQLKPGDSVVEAGCGWGGFALYMARNHDVRVKAYNISRQQVNHARETAQAEGLSDQVEYVLDDYRNIDGRFDVFVSVGMLEHVGPQHYPVLGQVIRNCLKVDGRGLIHSIGRNRARPINPWIERRIFPGTYPPTLREIMDIFESSKMSVTDIENLRLHYAKTLDAWLQRYEQNVDRIEAMMDERFVRSWRLYLAGSKAAFTSGKLQLFQVLFTREDNNELPWSRQHLYRSGSDEITELPAATNV